MQCALDFCYGPLAAMQGSERGDQHIGIVPDLIQIKFVLVVVMVSLVVIQISLKLGLHGTVFRFGSQHISVSRGISRTADGGAQALKDERARGRYIHQHG